MRAVKSVLAIVALAAMCAVGFVLDVALLQAMTKQLHMNDFGKFYYSAQAFLGGGNMYAPSPATNVGFVEAPELQLLNMNPPHFHLLVLPLAVLEPDLAVTIWVGVSLMALVVSLLVISRELEIIWTPTRVLAATAGTLVFAGTQSFFVTGNLSLLLLLALTICWASARHGRWTMAALWLGACLSIKPFLLIFAPYLLGARRFRALLVALGHGRRIDCRRTGSSSAARRIDRWYRALAQSGDWAWLVMNASTFGLFRRIFDTQPIGTPLLIAPPLVNGWIVAAALVGVVTLAVTIRDRAPDAIDRAFALLLVAAQLMSPLGWIYYLWLPAGPLAAVALRAGRESHQTCRGSSRGSHRRGRSRLRVADAVPAGISQSRVGDADDRVDLFLGDARALGVAGRRRSSAIAELIARLHPVHRVSALAVRRLPKRRQTEAAGDQVWAGGIRPTR